MLRHSIFTQLRTHPAGFPRELLPIVGSVYSSLHWLSVACMIKGWIQRAAAKQEKGKEVIVGENGHMLPLVGVELESL